MTKPALSYASIMQGRAQLAHHMPDLEDALRHGGAHEALAAAMPALRLVVAEPKRKQPKSATKERVRT